MESSSSDDDDDDDDDEDFHLPFWNNWFPPPEREFSQTNSTDNEKVETVDVCNPLVLPRISSLVKDPKYGNWIPSINFANGVFKRKTKLVEEKNYHLKIKENNVLKEIVQNCEIPKSNSTRKKTRFTKDKTFNCQKRMQLHDVTNFKDGDLIWGAVNLGVFAHIKLWINEYDNICGSADGTLSKLGSLETTLISITNAELLRKMLGLSTAQWASLCETIHESNISLNFDAFQDFQLSHKTPLEKLWFFICKRRHFLPDQIMLVKLCGAVKCMKKFKITPKVVVQEIKSS